MRFNARINPMQKASTLLPKILRRHGLKGEADASLIIHKANEWMLSHGAPEDAKATKLKDSTLFIEVENSTSAQECLGISDDLLHWLQKMYDGSLIQKLRILRKQESMVG